MRYFENAAYCRAGLPELMLEEVTRYWGGMIKEGATTFWEAYDATQTGDDRYAFYGRPFGKSLCHAWASGPLALFSSDLFGLKPVEPGWKTFTFAPVAVMPWASVCIPTPAGEIRAEFEGNHAQIEVPAGCAVVTRREFAVSPRRTTGPSGSRSAATARNGCLFEFDAVKRIAFPLLWLGFLSAAAAAPDTHRTSALTASAPIYGVLQDTAARWQDERAAGLKVIVLEPIWSRCEPRPDVFDPAYLNELKTKLTNARAAGFQIVLSPGWQYPPDWIFKLPHSRYVNQFGDPFDDPAPGMAGFNAVFNPAVRERLEKFLRRLLGELGTDFLALRLGGGWYNELNYPPSSYHGHHNCYWGYDDAAQGRVPGLPPGSLPARWRVGFPALRPVMAKILMRAALSIGIWTV